jgi:hypothetical protein
MIPYTPPVLVAFEPKGPVPLFLWEHKLCELHNLGRPDLMWRTLKYMARAHTKSLFELVDSWLVEANGRDFGNLFAAFLYFVRPSSFEALEEMRMCHVPGIVAKLRGPIKVANPITQAMIDAIPPVKRRTGAIRHLPPHLCDFVNRVNDNPDLWFGEPNRR